MKFWCIGDENTVRGFRLAGVAGDAVGSPEEARQALERAVMQRDFGVILVTEPLADGIRSQVDALQARRRPPLVVEIPGPDGPRPGRRSLRELAQEAVGISIK